jgi:hypothetical protein
MPIASVTRLRRLFARCPRARRAALPLRLEALEDRAVPATVTWVNPAGGDWDTAANWSDGTVSRLPGPSDDAVIPTPGITVTHINSSANDSVHSLTSAAALALSGGTLSLGAASEVDSLTQTGGTLTGAGDLTVDNALLWTSGTMSGGGHTVVNGTAEIGSRINFLAPSLSGRTLDNFGSLVVDNGARPFLTANGAFHNQAGAVAVLDGSGSLNGDPNPTGRLINDGELDKTGPDNAISTVLVASFDNSGAVDVRTGTLRVSRTLTNEGAFGLGAGAVVTLSDGTSSGDISLARDSHLSLTGAFTLQDGATVAASAGSQLTIDGGGLTQQAGSSISLAAGSALAFNPSGFETYTLAGGAVSGPGVVRLPSFSSLMTVTGSASIDNLSMAGGNITLAQGGSLAVTNLTQSGGAITGAGDLTVNGTLVWTGGLWSGAGETALAGSAEFGGSQFSGPSLNGRVVNNSGRATVDDGANVNLGGNAAINNQAGAALVLRGSGSLTGAAFGPSGTFTNAGRVVKTGADNGGSSVSVPFDNTGTVVVQRGTLIASKGLTNEGTLRLRPDTLATVTGGSSSGAIRLGAGSRLSLGGNFTLQAGTVHAGAGSVLEIDGAFTQQAGVTVTLAAGSLLDVLPNPGPGSYTLLPGGAVSGPGVVRLSSFFSQMTVGSGTSIDNLTMGGNSLVNVATTTGGLTVQNLTQTGGLLTGPGTVTVETSLLWTGGTMGTTAPTVLNGTAEIGGGLSGPTLNGRLLDDFGSVTVDDGTTLNFSGGAIFHNEAGAELDLPGASSLALGVNQQGQLNNEGLILKTGAGSQSNLSLPVSNSGTVEVVLGTLTVNGRYTQTADGALTVHLAGTAAGTQYGRLQVNGAATLDGTLNVVLDDGFSPADGDTFRVLTFSSRSGDFGTKNFPDLGEGLSFNPAYDSTGLNLLVQSS